MKTTDIKQIENLIHQLIDAGPSFIAVDRDDYNYTKGLFGEPFVAIGLENCDSVDSLINKLSQVVDNEDLSKVKALMMFLTTSRDNGMTMGELQKISTIMADSLPEDVRFLRSISFNKEEGCHNATLIIWK